MPWVKVYEIRSEMNQDGSHVCELCEEYVGNTYYEDDPIDWPPYHDNCNCYRVFIEYEWVSDW
jgi:hypothetical protein